MLNRLSIDQFVIIDKLGIDFKPALTVLTGETGAGKSILLDAMGLILGDEPNREAIRSGSEESVIDALFAPREGHPVWQFLIDQELSSPQQKEFTIRRTLARKEKDEMLVNGQNVDLELLKKIGTFLVEIHGQFANQNLLDPAHQLNLLDLFGNYPPEILRNVADSLHDVERYKTELEDERVFIARHGHEQMQVQKLVERMNELGMKEGHYEFVESEYARLLTAKETSEAFQGVLANLVASSGAEQALVKSNYILERNENLDKVKLATLFQFLSAALKDTRDAISDMTRLAPDYDIDTKPIYELEEKLIGLREIAAENDIDTAELFQFFERMSAKFTRITNSRARIAELDDLLEKSKQAYRKHAHILSEKRTEAAKLLSEEITNELPPLKLNRAQFLVQVEEKPTTPWTVLGYDEVIFMARMNPGMPFSSIADTASGGEMARLILALKVVVQRVQTIPTLVFDEVDTGIGGAAAAAVGERIAKLADTTQVLVITHSPQVASRGQQHLHVSKKTDGVTTTSVVRQLTEQERIDEISRMLAGDTLTTESHAAAQSLIDEADRAAIVRQQAAAAKTA